MNNIYTFYQKLIGTNDLFQQTADNVQYTGEKAADILRERILKGEPSMITRFGANELNMILNFIFINKSFFGNIANVIKGVPYFLKYKKGAVSNFYNGAGFFPPTTKNIDKYCELSIRDLPDIDILGSWMNHERFLYNLMSPDHVRVFLRDLSPVTTPNRPWTIALEGKKVLVIHPFEETIKNQFQNRKLLFENQNLLPDFELKTLKAVQTVAGNGISSGFKDWFEALDFMKEKISLIDFDVAILGCGAYGMPLAAYVKRMGKQAFHLGGETQIMFGIKGRRWELPGYDYQNLFYNRYWVRPLKVDTPANINKVEEGCYW